MDDYAGLTDPVLLLIRDVPGVSQYIFFIKLFLSNIKDDFDDYDNKIDDDAEDDDDDDDDD